MTAINDGGISVKRRSFFNTVSAASAASAFGLGCGNTARDQSAVSLPAGKIGTLAGMTLEELRELYHSDLYNEFLPFVDRYVIDHEYGGFMCGVDHDGTRINTEKGTWDAGRGICIFSCLYNTIDHDSKWLETARKSADFILTTRSDGDVLWHRQLTREGKPTGNPDTVIYSDIYVATGLQEFSRAAGIEYWDMAKEIMLKCVDIYDNKPGYATLKPTDAYPGVERPRIFSHWFQLGRLAILMLEKKNDPEVQAIRDRCIDAVMNAHWNRNFRLMTEYVNHDLTPIDSDYGQEISTHAQEMLWLIMNEAVRRKDRQLFETAEERFKRHVEVLWDDVYSGLFTLKHVDNNSWNTSKPLWMQVEVLVGTLSMIELTGDPWALEWFSRMYSYIRDTFYLKQRGLPMWIDNGDRKVTFEPHTSRVGIFQQPRHLMLNLLALDRMIKRGGTVSGLF